MQREVGDQAGVASYKSLDVFPGAKFRYFLHPIEVICSSGVVLYCISRDRHGTNKYIWDLTEKGNIFEL